jgi:hypothetical protein
MPSATASAPTVGQHFAKASPDVCAIYDRILSAARKWGPVEEDPKKTSIHLNRSSAFAGVATRKDALILTVKSRTDLESKRISKHERASANRWHLEIRLSDPKQVDAELLRWLRASYEISE